MNKVIRIGVIVIFVGFLFALAAYNSMHPSQKQFGVWNSAMTMGDKETAEHHFVMYTDIFCPYCDKFSNAVTANLEDFKTRYIDGNKILFEIRVTDLNYLSGHSDNSLPAGEGAYCAAKQNNFWGYYHALLGKLFEDYHSKGIGVDRNSEHIPELAIEYFYDAAEQGGLDRSQFISCMENHEGKAELDRNTTKTSQTLNGGVPYFVFDKFVYSGFMGDWDTTADYENVKLIMEAGLETK